MIESDEVSYVGPTLTPRFALRSFALSILVWTLTGATALASADQIYASLYPFYAEYCALSGIKKRPGFGVEHLGGSGGHAVLYLNGVCRVPNAHYPVIALCEPGSKGDGVGLSVNAHFKNANWVATEGKDFFFRGDLAPNERLTREAYERTKARAKEMGIYDGVEFHPEVFDDMPPGMSRREFRYEVSIATDYAVAFGRNQHCARVPVTRGQMAEMVQFLNDLNSEYRDGKKDYVWDVVQDNCIHTLHNAFSAIGLWDTWETDQFILIAAFDFPVPANEFVNLMRRTNDLPLDDLNELYADEAARRSLIEDGWLPTRPGALAEFERMVQNNDVFETDVHLIFFDDPIFPIYQERAEEIFSEPRYFDIGANLQYFAKLYQAILRDRKPLESYLHDTDVQALNTPLNVKPPEKKQFPEFYQRFYQYIEHQNAMIQAELAALPSINP